MNPAEQHEQSQQHEHLQNSQEARTPQVIQGGAGNVDKIRDILFGTQMRDYETRFARLEEAVAKETAEIRETNRRRFDQLEQYIKREFEALESRIKSEREERSDTHTQHVREVKEMGETLSRRLRELDDRGLHVERDLRNNLMEHSKDLGDQMRQRHEEVSTLLEKRVGELRHGKTDRAEMASLLSEMALRLNDQFQIPGSEG
jgi:DNA repair exonuclease SbcCD ATPase subunit